MINLQWFYVSNVSENSDDPNRPIIEPERLIANKIVNGYKEIFMYLDFIVVNDLLDAEELSSVFSDFGNFLCIIKILNDGMNLN